MLMVVGVVVVVLVVVKVDVGVEVAIVIEVLYVLCFWLVVHVCHLPFLVVVLSVMMNW